MSEITIKFEIDEEKAVKIAKILHEQFENRKGIFSDYSMPEYIYPRNLVPGSKEHALYFTYIISIDYMTDAEKLWKKARGAYELYPKRFTPKKILQFSDNTVKTFVRRLGARFAPEAAKTWKKISKILLEKYDGDPRNITPQPLTVNEIKAKLQEFPYLRGNKLSNFYIRAMGETGLFKVKNLHELDIPVDKQVARFTFYTGVVKIKAQKYQGCVNDDPIKSLIEEAWRKAAKKLGIPPWKLDEPIWTIGSKLCTKRKCKQCPIENLCNKTKGIKFKENTIIWENGTNQIRF